MALRRPSVVDNPLDVEHPEYEAPDEQPEDSESCATGGRCDRFCTAPWFLLYLCGYTLVQSMVVTGLFAASISTLERRYDYSATTSGFLAASYDFVVLLIVPFVGYYSRRAHKPRFLSVGFGFLILGAFFFSSPQLFGDKYKVNGVDEADFCMAGPAFQDCGTSTSGLVALLFLGQMFVAFGSAPLYTVGPAFLDEVVPKATMPMYLGIFYTFAALGPAVGFLLASFFLATWVDPGNEPSNIDDTDEEWVGAWWQGYIVAIVIGILVIIPGTLFPKFLPGTKWIREENARIARELQERINAAREIAKRKIIATMRRMSATATSADHEEAAAAASAAAVAPSSSSNDVHVDGEDKVEAELAPVHHESIWTQIKLILKNPTYTFNIMGQSTEAFAVSGFAIFLPRAAQSLFGLTAGEASLTIGLVIIPGAAGGTFFGGWLLKRLKASPANTARVCWIIALVALAVMFGFFIGCDTIDLAGVTAPYEGTTLSGINLDSTCNTACGCNPDLYTPMCGGDGTTYFSACHAGCLSQTGTGPDARFFNCTCMPSDVWPAGAIGGDGEAGKCDQGCNLLTPYLVVLFLAMFTTFMNNVPATTVLLKCVKYEHRSTGLGIQNFVFRVFGSIPAPIVFGAIIDSTCIFTATECDSELQTCWEYDTTDLKTYFVMLAVIPKFCSFLFFFLSWYFFKGPPPDAEIEEQVVAEKQGLAAAHERDENKEDEEL